MTHGLSCSETCGILLAQGYYLCPLHWQVASYQLYHQGSLVFCFVLPSEDPSNRTVRLEPNPKKKTKERVGRPLQDGSTFLIKNCGIFKRGPPAFACRTMPSFGGGTIVFGFWELELDLHTRS